MDSYPAIEDHGLIGDLQTAALVATDATIDWFCAPRFASPCIFAALLDRFRIAPDETTNVTKQLYLPAGWRGRRICSAADAVCGSS